MLYSSASSKTRFMYSSKPMMHPSMRMLHCSYSHTWILDLFCRYLKIKLMGCTITFWTLPPPLYAILMLQNWEIKAMEGFPRLRPKFRFSTKMENNACPH